MTKISWDSTSFESNLTSGDVHVWRSWLLHTESQSTSPEAILSVEEHTASKKFHFNHDRRRYILSHATLRKILSQYLSIPPMEISIIRDEFGKPAIETNAAEINFNISHSEDLALFAFAYRKSVGVDIEHVHDIEDLQGVANSFLSTAEMKAFLELPEEMQRRGFFRAWTRKEALSKAIGKGIAMPLDQFEVGVNPNEGPKLTISKASDISQANWKLIDLSPSPNYIGAIAVDSLEISLSLFTYP